MKKIVILLILLLFIVVGCSSNASKPEDAILLTVQSYVDVIYFENGTFEEFIELYANEKDAPTEEQLEQFISITNARTAFKTEDLNEVMQNMRVEILDEDNAVVYWEYENTSNQKWELVKIDEEWKLAD